jgi:hypothetical protein
MSLFGFSSRDRGQSESIIHSPLPLSTGNVAFQPPNTNGLSVELPPLPPLPTLPLWDHDNKDEFHSSHKVKSKNTVQSKPKSSTVTTEISSVMPFASSDVHFSGKTTSFGASVPQSNYSLHESYNHINTNNLSHLHDTTLHLESTHLQGTDQKFTFILLAF